MRLPVCLLACVALLLACVSPVLAASKMVTNPLISGVAADPDVLRIDDANGKPTYLLTHTSGSRDFPAYTSPDLVTWTLRPQGLLGVTVVANQSIQMGDYFYCSMWAPEVRPSPQQGGYILSFTSSRYATMQSPCPGYDEGSGTFVAWSASPFGPFDTPTSHPQPTGATLDTRVCPSQLQLSLPHATVVDQNDCKSGQGLLCNNTMRLDSDLFNDPLTKESWFAYSWYTNSYPKLAWEQTNLGEHVSIVKLNASNPLFVECDPKAATKVWVESPHDNKTLARLAESCPRCGEMLSFTKGRHNETTMRGDAIWGVTEGSMMFRRNNYVYILMSHSAWNSAYYSVMYAAAPSVEELALDNPKRLVGRFLIPSLGQSFGHGTAILGPDNEHWYYIHHHLDHVNTCNKGESCPRDIYISPLVWVDRKDGLGDVWIQEVFPAEHLQVEVFQAAAEEAVATEPVAELIASE